MTRVSENSNASSINYSINKSKKRLEDLQLKGTRLQRMLKPSDDPSGNVELMQIKTQKIHREQFEKNADVASSLLDLTENAIKEISDVLLKTKEIAISQASNFYDHSARENVAQEIAQLRNQVLSIANSKLGSRYLFAGYKVDQRPFSIEGKYHGDDGIIHFEVANDFFVPVNLPGTDLFYKGLRKASVHEDPLENAPLIKRKENHLRNPEIALDEKNNSVQEKKADQKPPHGEYDPDTIFDLMQTLHNFLTADSPQGIQNLLEPIDDFISQTITMRAKIGAIINTVNKTKESLEELKIFQSTRSSTLEDADIAELYSDISKQNNVLQTVYKSSAQLINKTLLDFLR